MLAHHRLPIKPLHFSASEEKQRPHGTSNLIALAFRYERRLQPAEFLHGPSGDPEQF